MKQRDDFAKCAGPGQADELQDIIPVTDDLEIELGDSRLRLQRRSAGTGITLYPHELRHLVDALVEAGIRLADARVWPVERNSVSPKHHGDEDWPAHMADPKYAVGDRVVKMWDTQKPPPASRQEPVLTQCEACPRGSLTRAVSDRFLQVR